MLKERAEMGAYWADIVEICRHEQWLVTMKDDDLIHRPNGVERTELDGVNSFRRHTGGCESLASESGCECHCFNC
jgi:hypothetical protein